MKAFSSGKKLSRAAARNAAMVNQLATPGLGSLMARRWVAGLGQLAVFLAGFSYFIAWFIQDMKQTMALLGNSGDGGVAPVPMSGNNALFMGVTLALVAWCWSFITSWQIMREAPVLATGGATTWQKHGEILSRTFGFPDFPAALRFVNAVAEHAEQVQHHPDIDIRWNKVTLALTTHDAGGLTDKDYALALVCDRLYAGG